MDILIFSNNTQIQKNFEPLRRDKKLNIQFHPVQIIKKGLKEVEPGTIIYVDISQMKNTERAKIFKSMKNMPISFGAIDPKGSTADIAEIFHEGASDYIGKDLLKKKIDPKRITRVQEYSLSPSVTAPIKVAEAKPCIISKDKLSGKNWSGIKPGQEYTFCFMFIELDDQKELRRTFGETNITKPLEAFRNVIGQMVEQINGRIWMWRDFGGLILFPFDGINCDAILAGVRLILYRKILAVGLTYFNTMISYRIAVHIGNSVYKTRGDTGEIISDSINAIFHLGQKYAKPCGFYITQEAFKFTHPKLKELFVSIGEYEGREIMRMKQLL